MAIEKIIVLDDDLIIRKTLEDRLRQKRFSVASCEKVQDARKYMSKDKFDIIFADMRLPDGEGSDLLNDIADNPDAPLVIMMTGYGSVESAVDCMANGAFHYVTKPFSFEQIEVLLKKAAEHSQQVRVNQYYSHKEANDSNLIGESKAMKRLKQMVNKVAKTEATVLITGENGTGKEMVANELYGNSLLYDKPFIKLNCAAIPENLIESEFFGHEKGAFTGATQRREGRFELANNGTILLDEIGEISPQVQVKLLRVLQEKEFERVGGNKTLSVKVRVLASTNKDLLQAVKDGQFREDLYYRLNVFPVEVPALRERAEDVVLIGNYFLKSFSKKYQTNIKGFSEHAIEVMLKYRWPGNVRELQNAVERAVIQTEEGKEITADMLYIPYEGKSSLSFSEIAEEQSSNELPEKKEESTATNQDASASAELDEIKTLEDFEKEHILRVLRSVGGNRTKTAEILKINIRTLRNKLSQYKKDGEDV